MFVFPYIYKALILLGLKLGNPADFVTPYDSLNSRGVEGLFLYASHDPFSFMRLNAQASRYKNSYTQAPASDVYNSDFSGSI